MGKELFELAEESLAGFLLINKCKKCIHYNEDIVCKYYQKVFGGNPVSGEDRTEVFREYFIFDRQKVAFICKKFKKLKEAK